MLEELYAGSVADAQRRANDVPLAKVESAALAAIPALDALAALAPADQIKVLAEVKRASPSRGDLADIPDPAYLAEIYAQNGASAISVLTEERRFKGSLDDLRAVRARVAVPVLRKDFIANEYQILEARAAGADIVLLIVAGLKQKDLLRLKHFTEQLGMTAFIETHDASEVDRALEAEGKLVGVNARDLSTFQTDRNLFGTLVHLFPADVIKVAESAVRNQADVAHYRDAGADVVLVGEALVTNDPAAMLKSFLNSSN
jgi:indole-3-glycerol phosphate synthase